MLWIWPSCGHCAMQVPCGDATDSAACRGVRGGAASGGADNHHADAGPPGPALLPLPILPHHSAPAGECLVLLQILSLAFNTGRCCMPFTLHFAMSSDHQVSWWLRRLAGLGVPSCDQLNLNAVCSNECSYASENRFLVKVCCRVASDQALLCMLADCGGRDHGVEDCSHAGPPQPWGAV